MIAKWYGIYTKIDCERKVSDFLTRRHIENYYPATILAPRGNFRWQNSKNLLFPSYLFVKTEEDKLDAIRNFPGVINLLFWLGKPVVIQDKEIEAIKILSGENLNIKIQQTKIEFEKISFGPVFLYSDNQGIKTLKLFLPSIGYVLTTEIETPKLKVIFSHEKNYNGFSLFNLPVP